MFTYKKTTRHVFSTVVVVFVLWLFGQMAQTSQASFVKDVTNTSTFGIADAAYTESNFPNTSTGGQQNYYLGQDFINGQYNKGLTRLYMKFSFGQNSLPPGSIITNAWVYLYQYARSCTSGSTFSYTKYPVTSNWAGNTITWNNSPNLGGSIGNGSFSCVNNEWKTINITSLVQSWYGGGSNYGVSFWGNPESNPGVVFRSHTCSPAQCPGQEHPYLLVEYTVQGSPTPTNIPPTGIPPSPTPPVPTSTPPLPKPNLKPITLSGWSAPIIPSNQAGTFVWESLYGLKYTFIDYAIRNTGNASAANVSVTLYLDDIKIKDWYVGGLTSGSSVFTQDYKYFICPGNHTLKLTVDPANLVAESNESDNTYEHTFLWTGNKPTDQGSWMPCGQSISYINVGGDYASIGLYFVWDKPHLDKLVSDGKAYQYEIRRSKEYWDYYSNGLFCNKFYISSLPGTTDRWSEEADLDLWPCIIDHGGNEEFELKTNRLSDLQVGKLYYVGALFFRDENDKNKQMSVTIESEYCKDWPFCIPGRMYYGEMDDFSVNSQNTVEQEEMQLFASDITTPTITNLGNSDYLVVISETQYLMHSPLITSTIQLKVEVDKNQQRVLGLEDTKFYNATITFRDAFTQSDLENLLGSVEILSVRFNSWPVGGGKTSYPPDWVAIEPLAIEYSNFISTTYGVQGTIIIDTYVGAEIIASGDILKNLLQNDNILSIDPGPTEYLEIYPNAILIPGDDIYSDYQSLLTRIFLPLVQK